MKTELHYYDIFPQVVQLGKETEITIRPKGVHVEFHDAEYAVIIMPIDQNIDNPGESLATTKELYVPYLTVYPKNGEIVFSYTFEKEQEYDICLCLAGDNTRVIVQLNIYCVAEDLYELFPFKIETHSHTYYSDARESPEFVPPYYRMEGFDALAITDHKQYRPSLEAIKAFENIEMAYKLYPGEEVHAPYNTIHIVNFGGNFSVNELYTNDFEKYDREVKMIMESTNIPPEFDCYRVASCIWVSREIHKASGLCILGHPFWRRPVREVTINSSNSKKNFVLNNVKVNNSVSTEMFMYMLGLKIFDAWEICGFSSERNNGHLGLYLEALQRGLDIPVLGANDSHGVAANTQYFNKVHSIVFAKENTKEELISRIKKGYCVAVEQHEVDFRRVYAKARFLQYTRFLNDNFYPTYEKFCMHEGMLLTDYVAGVSGAKEELERISQHAENFKNHYFRGVKFQY